MSTTVRFLSGVRPHVTLQQPGTGEGFATHIALVLVGVGQHVHVEGGHTDVHLVTDVAGLGVLLAHGQVGLLVSAEVGAGGKVFATLLTSVLAGVLFASTDLGSAILVQHGVHGEGLDDGRCQ